MHFTSHKHRVYSAVFSTMHQYLVDTFLYQRFTQSEWHSPTSTLSHTASQRMNCISELSSCIFPLLTVVCITLLSTQFQFFFCFPLLPIISSTLFLFQFFSTFFNLQTFKRDISAQQKAWFFKVCLFYLDNVIQWRKFFFLLISTFETRIGSYRESIRENSKHLLPFFISCINGLCFSIRFEWDLCLYLLFTKIIIKIRLELSWVWI